MKKYYSMVVEENEASVMIYGDITSWPWIESDVSSYTLSKEIEGLDVDVINVYINSYGGEVAEALAICSALKRHKARIKTYDDGFACSCAADIFMAGDDRIMSNASLLAIHNVWTCACGNANGLRKAADDCETINQATLALYLDKINITEDELKQLFDEESWLLPQDALEMGFATAIVGDSKNGVASQSVKAQLMAIVKQHMKSAEPQKQTVSQGTEPTNTPPEPPNENKPKRLFIALMGGKDEE